MSQIVIGITTEQLKEVDALCAKTGKTREQIAVAALEAHLRQPEPKPKFNFHATAAAPKKPNAGADKEE